MKILILIALSAIWIQSGFAQKVRHLPHTGESRPIPDSIVTHLRDAFLSNSFDSKQPLSEIEAMHVLNVLPDSYQKACRGMIEGWGLAAENTDTLLVHIGYVEQVDPKRASLLVVLRCMSTHYGPRDHDDRLFLMRLRDEGSVMEPMPLGVGCEACVDLFHITMNRVLQKGPPTVLGILYGSTSSNPCCDGPASTKKDELIVFSLNDQVLTEMVRLVLSSEEYDHDDEDGDTSFILKGDVGYENDDSANVSRIVYHFERHENGALIERGRQTLTWDSTLLQYVQTN